MKTTLVVTTINPPTSQMETLAAGCSKADWTFLVVTDDKTPKDWRLLGTTTVSECVGRLSSLLPPGYPKKNIGYLVAMRRGAKCIVETDDDNEPVDGFFNERKISVDGCVVEEADWINTHHFFDLDPSKSWARGFPLSRILDRPVLYAPAESANCPIQQSLVDGDPDLDAIFRLTRKGRPDWDERSEPVILPNSWAPINSQNTTWFPIAYPLMYLPSTCSWRACDIWRGYVAQRILREFGLAVSHGNATVFQKRNTHDLMVDFAQEVEVYLNVEKVTDALSKLEYNGSMCMMLVQSYLKLAELGVVSMKEMDLLTAWIDDLPAKVRLAA